MDQLKIKMVTDLVCSWCPIGYRNITKALTHFEDKIDTSFHFLPFELNPAMPAEGEDLKHHLQTRQGWNEQQFRDYCAHVTSQASHAGLKYDYSRRTHYYNTHKAHRLLHWAEQQQAQRKVYEALIPAYFEYGQNLSDDVILLTIIDQLGLNTVSAEKALYDNSPEWEQKVARVSAMKVSSIPTFIINSVTVTGSHSSGYFAEAIREISQQMTNQPMKGQ